MEKVIESRHLTFSFKGNSYGIEFPRVGQFFDIESSKASLSKGEYGNLVKAGTVSAYDALELIDVVSTLKVLCPKIVGDLGVSSLEELDAIDILELREVYRNQIVPWLNSWYSLFNKKDEKKG